VTQSVPSGRFTDVAVGRWHACAVAEDGSLTCWGDDSVGQATPPTGQFTSVAAKERHNCALRIDDAVVCWGVGDADDVTDGSDEEGARWGQSIAPDGAFVAVDVGSSHSCGIRESGLVECWGAGATIGDCAEDIDQCGMSAAPPDSFQEISLGMSHSCGVRTDGVIQCWGSNTGNRATPPDGPL
jgi:alpha-tubulin suppressor-like RCC1 family protein